MTRGIFDPTGGETERSGSTHLGPDAANRSHVPPDATDGNVQGDRDSTLEAVDRAYDTPAPFTRDANEAARRLHDMVDDDPPAGGQPA